METQTCIFIGNHPFMLNGKHTVCLFIRNHPFMLNGKYTECLFIENSYVMFHGKQRHHVKIKKNPTESRNHQVYPTKSDVVKRYTSRIRSIKHCQPIVSLTLTQS